MKRTTLLLVAALTAATGVNVVLWSAFVDSSGHASKLHGELLRTRADLHWAQGQVAAFWPDHPPKSVFKREVFPEPIEDPALATEVSGG